MSDPYICFVKYKDNKFNLIINDGLSPIQRTFQQIFPKMVEIFKKALKKDIVYNTYVLEVSLHISTDNKGLINSSWMA